MAECLTGDFSKSVGSLSEKGLIARFCAALGPCVPAAPEGAGDDCAVLKKSNFSKKNILSTSDAVILGRHFSPQTPARKAGKKLLNRNLSDIASMGGEPLYAMTSAVISPKISLKWLDEFAFGLRDAALKCGVKFIGGDVARGADDYFSMHLTLLGTCAKPLQRSGAKSGDRLFVTGFLGASFESGRHLDFKPRLKEGAYLASLKCVSACTDLSDGLASDIFDILPPNSCAEIFGEKIPVFKFKGNNLKKALCDGEDYELLFAVSGLSDAKSALFARKFREKTRCRVSEIGRISDCPGKRGLFLIGKDGARRKFDLPGFSHF